LEGVSEENPGVRGTRSFFLNGRPLMRLGYDELRAMVESKLAKG